MNGYDDRRNEGAGGDDGQRGYGSGRYDEAGRVGSPPTMRSWRSDDFGAEGRREVDDHVGKGPKNYQRSPERIQDEVCYLLERSGRVDASDIEVTVEGREITLAGTVSDREQKRCAEQLADRVYGVEDVHNRLRLTPAGLPAVQSYEDAIEQTRPPVSGGAING